MEAMTSERIGQLCRKNVALGHITRIQKENHEDDPQIFISFKRMDDDMLYFSGDPVDGESSQLWKQGKEKTYHGSRQQLVYVVDGDGNYITIIQYRGHDGLQMRKLKDYLREICSNPDNPGIADRIKQVIIVDTEKWHDRGEDIRDLTPENLDHTQIRFTVYNPPKNSDFQKLLDNSRITKNVYINNHMLIGGICREDADWIKVNKLLGNLTKRFQLLVYDRGLRSRIDQSKMKGMSAEIIGVKILTCVMCGRVMITLRRNGREITFIAAEDGDPRMGVQSFSGTLPEIFALVNPVIAYWNDDQNLCVYDAIKDDDKVSIG